MCLIFCLVQSIMARNQKKIGRERKQNICSPRCHFFFYFIFLSCAHSKLVKDVLCQLRLRTGWLAKKFQLCSSHVTLKMACKCCLDILLLMNQSAAGSKTRRNQSRIRLCRSKAGMSEPGKWMTMCARLAA